MRNAYLYAGGGRVDFALDGEASPHEFVVRVVDFGPGIGNLDDIFAQRYRSQNGMGLGLVGAKRLMDRVEVASEPGRGTTVELAKALPAQSGAA